MLDSNSTLVQKKATRATLCLLTFYTLAIFGLLLSWWPDAIAASPTKPAHYSHNIHLAQEGNYQPALHMLTTYRQHAPNDRRALYDDLIISGWAGKSTRVLHIYQSVGTPDTLPAKPLAAVARAYRNTQQWSKALALFNQGLHRFPNNKAFHFGKIMTLADAGQQEAAIKLGKKQVKKHPERAESHLALAYVYQHNAQVFPALKQATKAYALAPQKNYVVHTYINALQWAQLPQAALKIAKAQPGIIAPAQIRSLKADVAAQLTRVANTQARGEKNKYIVADKALAMYAKLIPAWETLGSKAQTGVQRLRADRLQALHARGYMKALISSYEAMIARGDPIPDYVRDDVADAYLYMHQPEKAASLFEQSRSRRSTSSPTPTVSTANATGLFYALTESGHYKKGNHELTRAATNAPTWLYKKGNPEPLPNDNKLGLELTRSMGYLYQGSTLKAQNHLDAMVRQAPNNSNLRIAQAQVYQSRELPRHAEQVLQIAQSQAPRTIKLETAQGQTALDLQEWKQAQQLRDDTIKRAPENQSVKRLDRAWQVHNMYELDITANRGVSTESPVFGSRDWDMESVLYTPPIHTNWRAFIGSGYSFGNFSEGRGHFHWLRAGTQWRSRNLTITSEVSRNTFGHGSRFGAALSAAIDLDDHWQIGAHAARLSRDTPVRALMHNITSKQTRFYVRWHGDERRQWQFTATPTHFSDGNHRLEMNLSGTHRFYTSPRLKLDGELSLTHSHNSRKNTPYFNPTSDFSIQPALTLTHTLYHRYETNWQQQFMVGAGHYSQQGFGSSPIFTLGYGQQYRYNSVLDAGFMLTGTSRSYDGQRERDYNAFIYMTYRF